MFELLLLIYLLPLLMIALLLFKLVVWIVRTAFRFVFWLVKKIFLILGRMLAAAFALSLEIGLPHGVAAGNDVHEKAALAFPANAAIV